MSATKKVSRKSAAAISKDAVLLRLRILETQVAELRRDLAPTLALRQHLADEIRLKRKLNALHIEAENAILQATPPKRSWWQTWWKSLLLGTIEHTVGVMSRATTIAEKP